MIKNCTWNFEKLFCFFVLELRLEKEKEDIIRKMKYEHEMRVGARSYFRYIRAKYKQLWHKRFDIKLDIAHQVQDWV